MHLEANHEFAETTRLNIRVARLDIVEMYQDTAITAVYALRAMPAKLDALLSQLRTSLVVSGELKVGQGMRQRLFDPGNQSYWPRLIVTDADRSDDGCPPPPIAEGDLSVKRAFRAMEVELIRRALARTEGNRTRAAELLELSSRALLYKIRDYGLE